MFHWTLSKLIGCSGLPGRCLDKLVAVVEYPFRAGYANIRGYLRYGWKFQDDLGESGLAVLALCIDNKWNLLGWADSNNMKNGLREDLLKKLDKPRSSYGRDLCFGYP